MKRLNLIVLLLIGMIIFGCASAEDKKSEESQQSETTISDDGKTHPEHLTYATFKEKVWDFETNPQEWSYLGTEPCIIDFYADWCQPCKMVAPIMEELSNDYDGKIKIYKVDTQTERELASIFQITGIPAILFVPKNGQPMKQAGAMSKDYYEKVINEFLLPSTQSGGAASQK